MADRNKHIDDLFREGLDDYQETPGPEVWASLEQRLSAGNNDAALAEQPSRKWLWYLLLLMLLATIGYFVYRQVSSHSAERGKINEATGINTSGPAQVVAEPPVDSSALIAASGNTSYTGEGSVMEMDKTSANGTSEAADAGIEGNAPHRSARSNRARSSNLNKGNTATDDGPGNVSQASARYRKANRTSNYSDDELLQNNSDDSEPVANSSRNRTRRTARNTERNSSGNNVVPTENGTTLNDQSATNVTARNRSRNNNRTSNSSSITDPSSVDAATPGGRSSAATTAKSKRTTNNNSTGNSAAIVPASSTSTAKTPARSDNATTDDIASSNNRRSSGANRPRNTRGTASQKTGTANTGPANDVVANDASQPLSSTKQAGKQKNARPRNADNNANNPVTSETQLSNDESDNNINSNVAQRSNKKQTTSAQAKATSVAKNNRTAVAKSNNSASEPSTTRASGTTEQKARVAKGNAPVSTTTANKHVDDVTATESNKEQSAGQNPTSKDKPVTVKPSQFKKGNMKVSDVSFDKDELTNSEEHFKPNGPILASSETFKKKATQIDEPSKPEQKKSPDATGEGVKQQYPDVEDDNFLNVVEKKEIKVKEEDNKNDNKADNTTAGEPNETPSRMLLATGSNPTPVSKDGPATNNGGSGGGGGGGGSDAKPKKNSERFNFAGGIKAAYERGFSNVTNTTFIFSPYLEWVISSHVSFVFQPGFRYNSVNKNDVFDITKAYHSITSSKLDQNHIPVLDTAGQPIAIQRNYYYTQTYDSILIGTKLSQKNYWEVELPIMLKYQLSPSFAILGGLSLTIGNLIKLEEDRQTLGSFTRKDSLSFPTVPIQSPAPGVPPPENYFSYNTPDISTAPAASPASSTNPARLGLMLGFSYEFSNRVMVDVMYKQTISDMKYIPNEQVRKLYTQPYFRVSVGMKLFGPQKKEPKNPAGL